MLGEGVRGIKDDRREMLEKKESKKRKRKREGEKRNENMSLLRVCL